jgi:hypothetical protein
MSLTTDPKELAAGIRARGWYAGPFPDDELDTIEADLALAARLLHERLDFGPGVARLDDVDGFVAVLAGVHHALAALAALHPFIDQRRQAVEAHGIDWHRHVDEVARWRDQQQQRSAA